MGTSHFFIGLAISSYMNSLRNSILDASLRPREKKILPIRAQKIAPRDVGHGSQLE